MYKILLFFFGVLWCAAGSEIKIPFGQLDEINHVHAEKRGQELAVASNGGMLLKINEGIFPYAELHRRKSFPLGDFRKGELLLQLFIDQPESIHGAALRLQDADGEIFQFPSADIKFIRGENWLRFPIHDGLWKGSWGAPGRVNRQIDWPLAFSGFSFRLKLGSGVRQIRIGEIRFISNNDTGVVIKHPLIHFDERSKFTITGAEWRQLQEGIEIIAQKRHVLLKEYRLPMRSLNAPRRLCFFGEARRGEGTLALHYSKADGTRQKASTSFKEGDRKFILEFPAGLGTVTFLELYFHGKEPDFELLLTASELSRNVTAAEAVKFEVDTGNPLHILKEGEEDVLRFTFTNNSEQPLAGNAELSFIDFFGNRQQETVTFALAPGAIFRHQPVTRFERFGIINVESKIIEKASTSTAFNRLSFARLCPSGPTPLNETGEFIFGLCSHTPRWSLRDQRLEAEAAALSGAKIIRGGVPAWNTVQPAPERWNFTDYDRQLEMYNSYGIAVQGALFYTPKWAAPPETRNSKDWRDWYWAKPDITAWRTFVHTIAARYRNRVNYWETWNEPDLYGFARFDVNDYIELQKAAFEEVRKAAPEANMMTAGFASFRQLGRKERDNVRFIAEALRKARGYYDIVATHEHGSFPVYARTIDELFLPEFKKTGAKGWYANETAISSVGGMENFQAETLFKKMIFAWSRGAIAYNWYDLRNDGYKPYNSEHHYGLVTTDFYPKPAYAAYTALTRIYRNARFLWQIPSSNGVWLFLFQEEKDLIFAGWNEGTEAAVPPLIVDTNAKTAEQIDLMGNAVQVALHNGKLLFAVGSTPSTLRLCGASQAKTGDSLFVLKAPEAVAPGQEIEFKLEFNNPFNRKLMCDFTILPGAYFIPSEQKQSFRSSPDQKQEITFRLKSTTDMPVGYGIKLPLVLEYNLPEIKCSGSLELVFQAATLVNSNAFEKRAPDFQLDRREQVVSYHEGQPDRVHRLWQGKEDHSADIWIGIVGENLKLRVLVTDDIHSQPESGSQVWRGDGIQFALRFPRQKGYWEIGLSRLDSGKDETFIWQAPAGLDSRKVNRKLRLTTRRNGNLTTYDALIPLSVLGTDASKLSEGFRFNLLINENDGEGRDGWMQIAPGIGAAKNPDLFPSLIFLP